MTAAMKVAARFISYCSAQYWLSVSPAWFFWFSFQLAHSVRWAALWSRALPAG